MHVPAAFTRACSETTVERTVTVTLYLELVDLVTNLKMGCGLYLAVLMLLCCAVQGVEIPKSHAKYIRSIIQKFTESQG